MILTTFLLGAVITAAAVGIVAVFWQDFLDFLKKAVNRVRQMVEGVLYGSKVFIRKLAEGVREISKHYSKVDEHWQETIVTRTVSASEVPEEILKKAPNDEEVDITDEMELQLETA